MILRKSTLLTVFTNIPDSISNSVEFTRYLIVENFHIRYVQIPARITETHIIKNPAATDKIIISPVNIPKNPQFLSITSKFNHLSKLWCTNNLNFMQNTN